MTDSIESPGQRIAEKLAARLLPGSFEPTSTWTGFGIGLHCDGCDLPVLPSESQVEFTLPDGRTIRFHAPCADMWRRLRSVLPLLRR